MTARSVARTTSSPKLGRANVVFSRSCLAADIIFFPHKMAAKNHRLSWHCRFKAKRRMQNLGKRKCKLIANFSWQWRHHSRLSLSLSFSLSFSLSLSLSLSPSFSVFPSAPSAKYTKHGSSWWQNVPWKFFGARFKGKWKMDSGFGMSNLSKLKSRFFVSTFHSFRIEELFSPKKLLDSFPEAKMEQ